MLNEQDKTFLVLPSGDRGRMAETAAFVGRCVPMNHIENANLAGVTLADLDWLLRGQASANVANRLRCHDD